MRLDTNKLINYDGTKIDVTDKIVVLYFYVQDDTSDCTTQATDFTTMLDDFHDAGAVVIGVSNDSCASHQNFTSKYDLKLNLISSEISNIADDFKEVHHKIEIGKKLHAFKRVTYVFDKSHDLINEYDNVMADGHAIEVLNFVKSL